MFAKNESANRNRQIIKNYCVRKLQIANPHIAIFEQGPVI
jgi:hypothetical protein